VKWCEKYGRKVSWNVKICGKYKRNARRILKRYEKYGRKVGWNVKKYGNYGRQKLNIEKIWTI